MRRFTMSSTKGAPVNENELQDTLKKLWDVAPPEVKAAVPHVLAAGGNVANVWALHENTIAPVNNILHYLDPSRVCSPQTAQLYVQQAKNNTGVFTHSQVVTDCMSSHTAVPEHVQRSILDGLQSSANTLIITSTVCAFVQVIFSAVSLWELYDSVREAKNLSKSSQIKLEVIGQKLKLVPEKLAALDKILEELSQEDIPMFQVTRLSNKANRAKTAIDSQLRAIVNEIDQLEVEINSKKVRLGAARKQAYMAGVSSLVNGVTSSVSVGLLAAAANPIVLGIAGVVAACNIILGVACPVYAFITEKELKELQSRLDDICKVKGKVEELAMKLTEQADLIYDRIDELTATNND